MLEEAKSWCLYIQTDLPSFSTGKPPNHFYSSHINAFECADIVAVPQILFTSVEWLRGVDHCLRWNRLLKTYRTPSLHHMHIPGFGISSISLPPLNLHNIIGILVAHVIPRSGHLYRPCYKRAEMDWWKGWQKLVHTPLQFCKSHYQRIHFLQIRWTAQSYLRRQPSLAST